MKDSEIAKLRVEINRHASEAATDHFKFIESGMPSWCNGHKKDIEELMRRSAETGATEAFNYLRRNSIL